MLTCTKDTHFFRFGGSCQCREADRVPAILLDAVRNNAPELWVKQFEVGDRVRWLVDGVPSPVAGTVIETYQPSHGPWWSARVQLDNGLVGSYFQAHLIPAGEVRCIYGQSLKETDGD